MQGTTTRIIAPFFADVNPSNGGAVTYGKTTFDVKSAFCVIWHDVSYYVSLANQNSGKRNNFQLLLVHARTLALVTSTSR